jgi:hypothetical protein
MSRPTNSFNLFRCFFLLLTSIMVLCRPRHHRHCCTVRTACLYYHENSEAAYQYVALTPYSLTTNYVACIDLRTYSTWYSATASSHAMPEMLAGCPTGSPSRVLRCPSYPTGTVVPVSWRSESQSVVVRRLIGTD